MKINNETKIDLPKLIDSRLLVQANSGGGKSWLLRRLLEQSHGKVQQIILDPEGEFSTLREKFDYVLCGKGGDTPAESRSAAMLAKKLLELNVSAIIDLYELHPQERKHFVRLFLDAMVNAPKELWHDCIVVLDEAHVFAPEKGESEAFGAVVDMATRGRKRGFCLIPATQRISKLHKDVAAECNNKLIGRSSLDIDMKRSGEELGFTSKDQFMSLRQLEPGEFYAFGPALSYEIKKVRVGDVQTSHPKAGSRSLTKVTPPTAGIKKILGKLADLPEEAKKEASTISELKQELVQLRRHKCDAKPHTDCTKNSEIQRIVQRAVLEKEREYDKERTEMIRQTKNFLSILEQIGKVISPMLKKKIVIPEVRHTQPQPILPPQKLEMHAQPYQPRIESMSVENLPAKLGICERKIYSFLFENQDRTFSNIQIGAVTGYSPTSGGFNNALSRLNSLGMIYRFDGKIQLARANEEDQKQLIQGERFSAEPSFWAGKLGKCEREIYQWLWDRKEDEYDKASVGIATGYSPTSGGFNNALSRLNSIGLIRRSNGGVRINPEILEI